MGRQTQSGRIYKLLLATTCMSCIAAALAVSASAQQASVSALSTKAAKAKAVQKFTSDLTAAGDRVGSGQGGRCKRVKTNTADCKIVLFAIGGQSGDNKKCTKSYRVTKSGSKLTARGISRLFCEQVIVN